MQRIFAVLAAAVLVPGLAYAQTRELATKGELLDRVAAVVNDGVVLSSELDEQIVAISERLRSQKLELPPQNVLRQQVLERLVLEQIQLQRADKAGMKIPDEALNNALQEVAQQNHIELSKLPEALAAQGIDYPSYRNSVRKELTLSLLRQRDVLQRISITPREIDQYLEKQKNAPSAANELDTASKRADEVFQKAKSGEDFAKLAVAYSNSQDALDGGALNWRKGTELPTFLTDVVMRLKPGEVGEPLRTPTGFHIVKLNEMRGGAQQVMVNQVHVRHILMKTNELADDATVRQKLADLRARILKGEDFAGLAHTSSEDPGSAAEGGDLGWTGPGAFVPEFEQVVAGLKDKEMSEPFKTQYGWHIVQLMGRREFDNTDELKRRHAVEEIRASKADEETELWLRRLRDEAYVELRV